MSPAVRAALRHLPPGGENRSGPLGPGLLASGVLCEAIRELQPGLAESPTLSSPISPSRADVRPALPPARNCGYIGFTSGFERDVVPRNSYRWWPMPSMGFDA
jgi:hypothetical protein